MNMTENLRCFVAYTITEADRPFSHLRGKKTNGYTAKDFKNYSYSDLIEYCCTMSHIPALREGLQTIMM